MAAENDVISLQEKAEQGDVEAQFKLGVAYTKGQGVSQDYTKAVEWFSKAAEQGHAISQFNLGCMYLSGRGVSQDDAKATEWLHKAAEQGNKEAKYFLNVSGR